MSFKDATEFNMFPSSKSQSHNHHKIECGHATVLRFGAIYGANGAGKSNLTKSLLFLQTLVFNGSLLNLTFLEEFQFMLDKQYIQKPSGIAVEFYYNHNVYYYHVEFTKKEIVSEKLLLSKKNKDIDIYTRNGNNISINSNLVGKGISKQFQDALIRLVRPDMLLFSFLGKFYENESPIIAVSYQWFVKLQVLQPSQPNLLIPHFMDINAHFSDLVNTILPELNTGISKLKVLKTRVEDVDIINDVKIKEISQDAKEHPGQPIALSYDKHNGFVNVVFENGQLYYKTIMAIHKKLNGKEVGFYTLNESDGTRRLIEYMPLLFDIINSDSVYVVDEIERSLHPIMIKDIISKISESKTAKGQLIFTTHESCLLDQNIFRPDEIWFAQKDVEQATQLYPLSDFNIHKTANIENGYLNGRYGGVPFLSNLKDLNW